MGRYREFDLGAALEAALSTFWKKGFEGTSFDDLTRATGVARPGLYAAFGNKEALFRKAMDRYEATHLASVRAALEAPTAREVVRRHLEGNAEIHTRYPETPGCLGINGALACSDDGEAIRQELIRRRMASEAALRERFLRAQAEGDLPPGENCATLASYVTAISQGMAVHAKAGASRATLDAIAAHVVAVWPSP